jgi:hypothetical protein
MLACRGLIGDLVEGRGLLGDGLAGFVHMIGMILRRTRLSVLPDRLGHFRFGRDGLERRLVPHAGNGPAGQQQIQHRQRHALVEVVAVDGIGQAAFQDVGGNLAYRVFVAEPAAHIGLGRRMVERRAHDLGVRPQDIEFGVGGLLVEALRVVVARLAKALHHLLGGLAPFRFLLVGNIQGLEPAFDHARFALAGIFFGFEGCAVFVHY